MRSGTHVEWKTAGDGQGWGPLYPLAHLLIQCFFVSWALPWVLSIYCGWKSPLPPHPKLITGKGADAAHAGQLIHRVTQQVLASGGSQAGGWLGEGLALRICLGGLEASENWNIHH